MKRGGREEGDSERGISEQGFESREGDVGRGLQVVFAKLKGQQFGPIC